MWRDCRQRPSLSRIGHVPWRSVALWAVTVSSLGNVAAKTQDLLLMVDLNLKVGNVLALVDTGDQFSRVRSDVIDYLYHRGERCIFFV